jgi:hypothetical protein
MGQMRRALVGLVLLVAVAVGAPTRVAGAVSPTTTPPTSAPYDLGRCVSALPPPGCGEKPKASGDRGGWEQILLFGIVTGAMAGIGLVIVRSTIRRDRATRLP